jgi:hypothetical protein
LYVQMRSMQDTPERKRIIEQMRDMAVEDCPLIPLSYDVNRTILQPWMLHSKPHPIAYDTTNYWAVDPKKRAAVVASWNAPRLWPVAVLVGLGAVFVLPAGAAIRRHNRRYVRRGRKQGDPEVDREQQVRA